jgi:DNA-binding Xre family transcriptional regulator
MISNNQIKRLKMLINKGLSCEDSAEKTGISEKTARKYLKSGKLPEELRKTISGEQEKTHSKLTMKKSKKC